ncbi:spore coat protein [Kyrpidia tusciae]|uniref:Coat F domain protein n=1 Tax=Kyrpidia tusciae (strain DSM 2912 / NBRC 15312 / T2) TaxID=562970 RepID=D5WSM8_KYRT2|nr:spore coat protein [Kyrpidia tusciae]ADG07047.1 Coat F domain protein [Kyrpidia tusciae DSM 2912]
MPYGAHEAMETHEILNETRSQIEHFSFYARQCQDQSLKQMIERHIQSAVAAYNEMVNYTHTYKAATPHQPDMRLAQPQQIAYGLRQPAPVSPQTGVTSFNDQQIAGAVLSAHKNSARNHMQAALECADPNLRQMMVNGAVTCAQHAYETFLFMNQKGWYQVPTLLDKTAQTLLHTYQPIGQQAGPVQPAYQ